MQFHVADMECQGCARSVTKAVQSVDPKAELNIDLEKRNITITSQQPAATFESALKDAGFPTSPVN